MHELWLRETKIWKKKDKVCWVDIDSLIAYTKTGIYTDIAKDVQTRFDTYKLK